MTYQPELGQMLSGASFSSIETPRYVMDSMSLLDNAFGSRVEGDIDERYLRTGNNGGEEIRTAAFAMRAYCWCDGERPGHQPHCPPNFHHFSSDTQVHWYKHSRRGSTINRGVSAAEWATILEDCLRSIAELPRAYRVMITGSREWARELRSGYSWRKDWASVPSAQRDVMTAALREARGRAGDRHMVIVHGGALGADSLAAHIARTASNAHEEAWPALWQRAPEGIFPENVNGIRVGNLPPYYRDEALMMATSRARGDHDKRAGFARNEAMLASGVDEVLAFFAEGAANRGTQGAVTSALRLEIPVHQHRA